MSFWEIGFGNGWLGLEFGVWDLGSDFRRACAQTRDPKPYSSDPMTRVSERQLTAKTSRASATLPVTAAAATMSGLMRIVRPVVLPWRPLKLRFDELAQS